MRNTITLLAALLVTAPLHAQSSNLRVLIESREPQGCYDFSDSPIDVVCSALESDRNADTVLGKVASQLKISRDSASAIVEASLQLMKARESYPFELDETVATALDDQLHRAIARETNALPLILVLADLTAMRDADMTETVLPLLERLPDPVAAIVETAQLFRWSGHSTTLLSAALRAHPDNVELISALGERGGAVGAANGPARITPGHAELRASAASMKDFATSARRQIANLTGVGLAAEARALFEALPAEAQQKILRARDENSSEPDLRLGLAAAYLLTGNRDRANEIVTTARTSLDKETNDAALHVLDAALAPAKGDFFDVIVVAQSLAAGTVGAIYIDLLETRGYPALAAEQLRNRAMYDEACNESELCAMILANAVASRARAELLAPESKDSPAAKRLLEAPRLAPFRERPLPDEIDATVAVIDCSDAEKVAKTTHLPPYVYPIRMERDGQDVAAIAVSSMLDPTGELGMGGYWVLRSRDGGTTWTSYYTGLRENLPYVVVPASRLPLLDGDRLHVEVEVKELDLESISFPPVGLRTKREATGLYLDFAWSDLARDSDGDGLTDLLEERIVSDPHAADTDGDGISDGRDSLPQIAMVPGRTPRGEALAYAAGMFHLGTGAMVTGIVDNDDAKRACVLRESLVGDATLFMIGDRSAFAALDLPKRTIVLTPGEHALYEKKFGPTYGATMHNFVVDQSGTRVLIELNEAWKGTTLLLTKTKGKAKGGWKVDVLSRWIS